MSKRKKYKNASLNIRGNPQFGKRVEKSKKGKGSYNRKEKHISYQSGLVKTVLITDVFKL